MDSTKDYLKAEIQKIEDSLLEHTKMLSEANTDDTLRTLIQDEIKSLEEQKSSLEQSLAALDDNQSKNSDDSSGGTISKINPNIAILEIRAGTGGDEAGLFARDLFKMYSRYGEKNNWKFAEIFSSENESNGIKTLVVEVKGLEVFNKLKNESGVHRVQRIPVTEAGGRIHTSTATIVVLPELKKVDFEIKPDDLKWEFFRAGGKGGQNVNKVSTAVRLTHVPTQIIVECREERFQGKNREKAYNMLQSKIFTLMEEQHVKSVTDLRSNQVTTGERSDKIRTYNFPQDRITDHRINKSWHGIALILNGAMDDIFEDLKELDTIDTKAPTE